MGVKSQLSIYLILSAATSPTSLSCKNPRWLSWGSWPANHWRQTQGQHGPRPLVLIKRGLSMRQPHWISAQALRALKTRWGIQLWTVVRPNTGSQKVRTVHVPVEAAEHDGRFVYSQSFGQLHRKQQTQQTSFSHTKKCNKFGTGKPRARRKHCQN